MPTDHPDWQTVTLWWPKTLLVQSFANVSTFDTPVVEVRRASSIIVAVAAVTNTWDFFVHWRDEQNNVIGNQFIGRLKAGQMASTMIPVHGIFVNVGGVTTDGQPGQASVSISESAGSVSNPTAFTEGSLDKTSVTVPPNSFAHFVTNRAGGSNFRVTVDVDVGIGVVSIYPGPSFDLPPVAFEFVLENAATVVEGFKPPGPLSIVVANPNATHSQFFRIWSSIW